MHITNQTLSLVIFMVEYLHNIFMEHDLNILMIFGIKEKWMFNIKNVKGVHYRRHLDEHFTVFMIVSHSPEMLLKLEKCIPISHVI